MNKKNKGKNKPKNPIPIPPQQQPITEKEPELEEEEERVPEIVPEVVVPCLDQDESSTSTGQTPAKPKRHRAGKKRKQNEKQEYTDGGEGNERHIDPKIINEQKIVLGSEEIAVESQKNLGKPEPCTAISVIEAVAPPISNISKEPSIAPAARKKKGKQPKNLPESDSVSTEVLSMEKPAEINVTDTILPLPCDLETLLIPGDIKAEKTSKADYMESDAKGGKKKNKPNKNKQSCIDPGTTQESEKEFIVEQSKKFKQSSTDAVTIQSTSNDEVIIGENKKNMQSSVETAILQDLEKTKEQSKEDITKIRDSKSAEYILIDNPLECVDKTSGKMSGNDFQVQEIRQEPFSSENFKSKSKNKKDKKFQKEFQHKNKNISIITEEKNLEPSLETKATDLVIAPPIPELSTMPESKVPESFAMESSAIKQPIDPVNFQLDYKILKVEPETNTSSTTTGTTSEQYCLEKQVHDKTNTLGGLFESDAEKSVNVKPKIAEIVSLTPACEDMSNNDQAQQVERDTEKKNSEFDNDFNPQITSVSHEETSESRKKEPKSTIEESCDKFIEALLVTDIKSGPEKNTAKADSLKEEEFIIRLFDKPVTDNIALKSKFSNIVPKKLTTDLKGKVMEVNKDMEDLKLSIEKSLAELTAIEEDDMPELVSITDCSTSSPQGEKQEATAVRNLASETIPVTLENVPPLPTSPTLIPTSDNSCLTGTKTHDKIPEICGLESEKAKEKTLEQHHKKHKGKGKCSSKSVETLLMPSGEIAFSNTDRNDCTPSLTIPDSSNISQETTQSTNEPFLCGHEHKGKGKGKNKKKCTPAQSDQSHIQSISVQETSSQTSTVTQEQQKSTKVKSSQEEKSKEDKSTKQQQTQSQDAKTASHEQMHHSGDTSISNISGDDNNTIELLQNVVDTMTSSLENINSDIEVINSENTNTLSEVTSFVIPIENENMLYESQTMTPDIKPPEENKQIEKPLSTRSKNLLGHPDMPVTSSKTDYKKEKNKNMQTPNTKQAKTKVKDSVEIESKDNSTKSSKQSQTANKIISKRTDKSSTPESDNEDEYVYKYSFRKVFLTNACQICKAELRDRRLACGYCNLIFYCSQKHKEDDWAQHQALCFAVSTIAHLKGLKFIYADAAGVSGQDYRLLRMQVIVSCEKILKRKLLPCEQEALLYPRICSDTSCREWKTGNLIDCEGCGLVSYCEDKPDHLVKDHQAWCKSYRLYYKLVTHQQSKGRLEPRLPSKVIGSDGFQIPKKINELLAQVYEEKIDMDDAHYAALTQLATAPLTAAYSYQLHRNTLDYTPDIANGHDGKRFTLHIVGAELQFEADTLNKWEVFFLHLRPDVQELRVVFIGPELNPSKLPLDLLAKIKMCRQCHQDKRRIIFNYQDGQLYHIFTQSKEFTKPDIVCAFNPGLHRTTGFGGVDSWPETINCILKLKTPFCVTSYTKYELPRDLLRIRECSNHQYKVILEPILNPYASIRPDRNFISDDEMPLIFKNYYLMVLSGTA